MASLSQPIQLPKSVKEVETLAARRELDFSLELGFDNIVLEGDSEILIKTLQTGNTSLAQYGHIANERYTLPCFASLSFHLF